MSSHSPTNSRPLEVVVVDTAQDEDVWINDELVRLGLAKFSGPVVAVQTQLYTGMWVLLHSFIQYTVNLSIRVKFAIG